MKDIRHDRWEYDISCETYRSQPKLSVLELRGGWQCLYLRVCRILIEMTDVVFWPSCRIVEP
jgi:hypothetical protein